MIFALTLVLQLDPVLPIARQYFAEARVAAAADGGRLWGKRLTPPILLIDDTTRRVYASQADPEGKLAQQGDVWSGELPANLPVANYAFKWSGLRWMILARSTIKSTLSERLQLFMHESFHWLQPELGLAVASGPCTHLDSYAGRLWLRLEGKALVAALRDEGHRKQHVADALLFRAYRQSLIPEARERERLLELNEGLAQYTGDSLMGMPPPETLNLVARTLDAWPASRPSLTRWYAYDLTPAYGLLLDEASSGWRTGLTGESDISGLLAGAMGWSPPGLLKGSAMKAAKPYGYSRIDSEERARESENQKVIQGLVQRLVEGPVVVLPLPSKRPFGFRTDQMTELPPYGTVFSSVRLEDEWGTLTVTTGQVLISTDRTMAYVAKGSTGWDLQLKPGYELLPGERNGDQRAGKRALYSANG